MIVSRLWAAAVAALTLAAFAPDASAQDIKISHQWRQGTDARDLATRVFTEEAAKLEPSLRFRIYPGSSLIANPVAQLDAMQAGTLEMAVYPLTYAVGKVPEFSITIMPGTVRSLAHAKRMKNTPFHAKLQDVAAQAGIRVITWWWTPGGFATKDREITGPDSVRGLSMRAADPTFEAMLKSVGASVHNMPSTEIYPAMQSGVLNATLTSAETFVSARLYEQTKFATIGGDYTLWMLLQPLVMSKTAWDRLTPAQQRAITAAADKSDSWFDENQAEATSKMVDVYTKAGAKVRPLTKAEYDSWVALAKRTAWVDYVNQTKGGKELLDLISAIN